ncbi:PadR family transcriptional regulator [Saccharomonospora piscinae]|uniref:helix-turn-helix transcriptional regulator n=1 Tax=Saccharomonospora piscinae TaxID=687388 RepID=UPI00110640D6|nr:helix-turn-helix transcriptional regulator [Saccharomonospora piscinae]TLW94600.1 PadR family transcriptional regulator [Saccharomonospora piscinae]
MRNFILGLLLLHPLSLYEVHARFAGGLAHIYAASYGSIHRSLTQLVARGDIEPEAAAPTARNRKRYVVTDQGKRTWLAWMKESPGGEGVEVAALARVFLLGLVEDRRERLSILAALREHALAEHEALLGVDRDAGAAGAAGAAEDTEDTAGARYRAATLAYGVATSKGLVDWLDAIATDDPAPAAPATPATASTTGGRR